MDILFAMKRIWYRGKDGVPHIRDFDLPCHDFNPGTPNSDSVCQTDGHYLCGICRYRSGACNCPDDCVNRLEPGGPWDKPGTIGKNYHFMSRISETIYFLRAINTIR